jgi:hypothetical protein
MLTTYNMGVREGYLLPGLNDSSCLPDLARGPIPWSELCTGTVTLLEWLRILDLRQVTASVAVPPLEQRWRAALRISRGGREGSMADHHLNILKLSRQDNRISPASGRIIYYC